MSPTPSANSWGREVVRILIHALVGVVIAVPTGIWAARGVLADITQRVAIVEKSDAEHGAQLDQLRLSIVPRAELEAHWRAAEESARETREDIRELRRILEQRSREP